MLTISVKENAKLFSFKEYKGPQLAGMLVILL